MTRSVLGRSRTSCHVSVKPTSMMTSETIFHKNKAVISLCSSTVFILVDAGNHGSWAELGLSIKALIIYAFSPPPSIKTVFPPDTHNRVYILSISLRFEFRSDSFPTPRSPG